MEGRVNQRCCSNELCRRKYYREFNAKRAQQLRDYMNNGRAKWGPEEKFAWATYNREMKRAREKFRKTMMALQAKKP